ncbi:DUF3068 domain-containing protein [Marmoricola sp. RAF53]|uniref:DUF3068 domain-containing protein n=1 Tax=Marmoricola sp. RAF53 TaxID=3233059 RepID=UPI003F9B0221
MRKFSLAMIGIGVFLIVMAPMIKFYMYPRLAVAPAIRDSMTGLQAEDAVIFDIATLKPITTDLTARVHTVGDATTPDKCAGDVTYVNSTTTTSADGVMRNQQVERMTLDARTAMPNSSCGKDFISTEQGVETPVAATGLQAKFPFNTQKKDYPFWDSTLHRSYLAKYHGAVDFRGLHLYEFVQDVPRGEYGTQELPASVLGLPGEANVTAQMMYANERTFLVEPETGLIVQRTEKQDQALDYEGQARVPLTKATLSYDAKTVAQNVEDGQKGDQLHLMRATAPQVLFGLGMALLVAGIVLSRRRSGTGPAHATEARELAGVSS